MNEELREHYEQLYKKSIQTIQSEVCTTDPLINDPADDRCGLTLLARPPHGIKENIQGFLQQLKSVEPHHYYYRNSDIHITVMSIISAYSGFQLNQAHVPDYIEKVVEALSSIKPFKVHYKGITASPSSIMICGYPEDSTLNQIRTNLREVFKNSDLEESIDKRYTIKTAHSTVVRFQQPLNQKEKYLRLLDEYHHFDFGSFEVKTLELVFNDWYQKTEKVDLLKAFELPLD
ncbi:2'-5' RNA ligase family protein [Fulvivirga ligni]|uniref:2'-5' RNA ligase family protein n=1 Tax=Fulvivirga ligni TaxID=2904246 RepID=UPI001F20FC1A|nr:2'-5' RNA ligase family protein [Fulvivirga ligni]UII19180.1 mutarotase [Fulvivirga ligni]